MEKPVTENELINSWINLIKEFTHPFITKLATLRMQNMGIQEMMPSFLKAYHLAIAHQLMTEGIDNNELDDIDDLLRTEEQITPMLELLEHLKLWSKKLKAEQSYFVGNIIKEALNTYPNRVVFTENADFQVNCSPFFITTLLKQFLKMALESDNKVNINIFTTTEQNYHSINLKAVLSDKNELVLKKMFDSYLTNNKDEYLPGPGFCRLAIQYAGGDVLAHHEDTYAHIVMKFPKIG